MRSSRVSCCACIPEGQCLETCSRYNGSLAPRAERGDQLIAHLVGQRLARQPADGVDRAPQLLEVARAVLAAGDVRLEAAPVAAGECPLEGVGDQLDDFLAAQRSAHVTTPGWGSPVVGVRTTAALAPGVLMRAPRSTRPTPRARARGRDAAARAGCSR